MALNAIAKAALEDHLPLLSAGHYAVRYGWAVSMDWETGLCHVQLHCPHGQGETKAEHVYALRLSFDYYPMEQPGVIFVNPVNREVGLPEAFERWWPNIDGNPWINIQINAAEPLKSYLCFQWTHEFKQTHALPAPEDPKRWDPEKHTVVGVVRMVQRALNSSHYKGYRRQ